MRSFATHCVTGLEVVPARTAELLAGSLMLMTALSPHIGYDLAARIARQAHQRCTALREAALASGELSAAEFDAWVQPAAMVGQRLGPPG